MKLLAFFLLPTLPLWGQGRPGTVPHFLDERVVKQRVAELSRQGVREFAVYQRSVPTRAWASKTEAALDYGRTITYCFWKAGGREYAQKYTDSTTYQPVALTNQVFGFPAYATTAVTEQEQNQLNLSPPFTDARPAPRQRNVVIFRVGSQLRYFETKELLTYDADPARQRRREQWAARLQTAAAQAEARFGQPQFYRRPKPWETE